MRYNTRVKLFPDGKTQYLYSSKIQDTVKKPKCFSGEHVGRGEVVNLKAAKQNIYDLAQCNNWNWFITLTFDPSLVDTYDYDSVSAAIRKYTRHLRYMGHKYILVPELHEKGDFHFHGLIFGDLQVVPAINPYTGEQIFDKKGNQVYNVLDYKFGFTTATRIIDQKRAATYLTKYLSKDLAGVVPKGRNRYWASKGLDRPEISYETFERSDLGTLDREARYKKRIDTDFGVFEFFELDTEGG